MSLEDGEEWVLDSSGGAGWFDAEGRVRVRVGRPACGMSEVRTGGERWLGEGVSGWEVAMTDADRVVVEATGVTYYSPLDGAAFFG